MKAQTKLCTKRKIQLLVNILILFIFILFDS